MEKSSLINLMGRFASLSQQECEFVLSLRKEYPYCQLFHVMAARATRDLGLDQDQRIMHMSAIYCANRRALYAIITAKESEDIISIAPSVEASPATIQFQQVPEITNEASFSEPHRAIFTTSSPVSRNSDLPDLASILSDIESLRASQSKFEEAVKMIEEEQTKKEVVYKGTSETAQKKKLIENPSTKEGPPVEVEKPTLSVPPGKPKYAKKSAEDEILDSIKKRKKGLHTERPKQKEQAHLIDQFIKKNEGAHMNKRPLSGLQQEETSDTLGSDIATETLVDILISQKKNEQALEILKKLIWKYPHKKPYFENRIKELH